MTSITSGRGATLSGTALLAGILLLSACSTGTGESSASAVGAAVRGAPAPAAQSMNPGTQAGGSASGNSATQTARLGPANQSIIYTAGLTLRSANAMTTAKRAVAIVTAAGGYTSAENATARSGKSGGMVNLTLKVPVSVYQQILAELSAPSLGKQISLTQQATDVTQQVADVNSLVSSEQAAITALRGLLRHAANVSELLQVQQQISTDESTLESLLAQQRALNHETSFATINMTLLSAAHRAAPHAAHAGGFAAGLGAGWRALRHATSWLLTALGAALPFLIIVVVVAGLGYAGRRRIVRRRAGPTEAG